MTGGTLLTLVIFGGLFLTAPRFFLEPLLAILVIIVFLTAVALFSLIGLCCTPWKTKSKKGHDQ
ncbi:hypothetical protein [Amycolatopsis azurea]|uniref:Uncharacterized protein n=1 Tax=Amycolatopsis azurea DSM 43854 TaxID=1238180 RepID=M2QNL0_9PSEU|nr:hypothetical protein [Amycolatopsis azurea]EMD27392.1 hypothetical protein C791_2404 [Amycolatopsis azurea DSM 43854]OOC03793.1 hypothetical protein B0293_26395 [Amycolatopsis azurea DSM 43854]